LHFQQIRKETSRGFKILGDGSDPQGLNKPHWTAIAKQITLDKILASGRDITNTPSNFAQTATSSRIIFEL
jgi:hypothetical protein